MTGQHPLAVAARQPLALLVLAATILISVFVVWWMLPLGLVAYAVTVWSAANDPNILYRKPERPKLAKITSQTFKSWLDSIDRVRREIDRTADESAAPLQRILRPIAEQADELHAQANALADKGQVIEHYLQTSQPQRLSADIAALDQRIHGTRDQYTADQLKETRAALIDRQQNAEALTTFLDRIMAQLQNICANLENILAETVRLRTAEAATASTVSTEISERLMSLNADMDAFQQVLEGAISRSGAA